MVSLLKKWFSSSTPEGVDETYIALVQQARNPFFYTDLAVPDTLDGRFEMVVLHLFLVQHRLLGARDAHADDREAIEAFARSLSECFFNDMDRTVREMGVADTGVGKRIKRMGKAYHGRLQAYEAGLSDKEALHAALSRNLYGTVPEGEVSVLYGMSAYMRRQVEALAATPVATIMRGAYGWGIPAAGL